MFYNLHEFENRKVWIHSYSKSHLVQLKKIFRITTNSGFSGCTWITIKNKSNFLRGNKYPFRKKPYYRKPVDTINDNLQDYLTLFVNPSHLLIFRKELDYKLNFTVKERVPHYILCYNAYFTFPYYVKKHNHMCLYDWLTSYIVLSYITVYPMHASNSKERIKFFFRNIIPSLMISGTHCLQ